jgi:hypothetical protein
VVLVVRAVEQSAVLAVHKISQVEQATRQALRHHRATMVELLVLHLVVLETLVRVAVRVVLVATLMMGL